MPANAVARGAPADDCCSGAAELEAAPEEVPAMVPVDIVLAWLPLAELPGVVAAAALDPLLELPVAVELALAVELTEALTLEALALALEALALALETLALALESAAVTLVALPVGLRVDRALVGGAEAPRVTGFVEYATTVSESRTKYGVKLVCDESSSETIWTV